MEKVFIFHVKMEENLENYLRDYFDQSSPPTKFVSLSLV